ncbi:FHS family L-fucose permease-like MFS transporter [Chitinophaga terrae (ex Kim and Jung 2007)]|jgi:FHS family L-fucose permease-like MFS transporter|uniref:sugar MFS transporter n=1 Tax=Chitinophaga terrae (ex Kim and Jung 2007) TaxID=408074 RepID=UPI0027852E79|nr:sugar MFS transporter [Chitinophaga terrae (ex Kim and Jung 2007)]MDQ0108197.1 FHS family L-fucose permease-like MFS transporter [Chitinophaga terrae (ex Kim and Jung 2007)]
MAGGAVSNSSFTTTDTSSKSNSYLFPFILVTSLFFLWGLAYGLLDVLNKHFQEVLNITAKRSTLLQGAYFGAYFLMALPAGIFMKRFGYKSGIILGLFLYAIGAFMFYPSAGAQSFNFFLASLFILACGLACLETAANPYVTVLGPPATATQRLNLSQCFNGLGSFLGPIIGHSLFFGSSTKDLSSVQLTYIVIGCVVLLIAGFFYRTPLPEIKKVEEKITETLGDTRPLFEHKHFVWSVVAQFFYVAAQVGVGALFINYVTAYWHGLESKTAALLLSVALGLFTVGRFVGTALMRKIAPNKLLAIYAAINVALCLFVMTGAGPAAVIALIAVFFFMSIMFPTIFALGVKNLGIHTERASSFQIMSIVGGASLPYVMGIITDLQSVAISYVVPAVCFVVVFLFGWKGYKTN